MPEVSVVIRARNEEKWLGKVLEKLQSQTYQDFEIIIVDSGSTDRTLEIAGRFPANIIRIQPEEFSYPRALNMGVEVAQGKYIVILSAHSIPFSRQWLERGIRHFKDPLVMGVYGPQLALPGSTIWDILFYFRGYLWEHIKCFPRRHRLVRRGGMGVLGFTNTIIRRDLWERHHFDERYGAGGEDGEWAGHWFAQGYIVMKDIELTVYHSHNLGLAAWKEQFANWSMLGSPHPFQPLSFRRDGPHRR